MGEEELPHHGYETQLFDTKPTHLFVDKEKREDLVASVTTSLSFVKKGGKEVHHTTLVFESKTNVFVFGEGHFKWGV